jgi:hypothetical protein
MPAPTVTGVAPVQGPTTGGTTVIITGTNFLTVTSVQFGTATASFAINSATQITALSPVHAAGTVDVQVVNPDGASAPTAADQFLYVAVVPTVTQILPAQGPTSGGTVVTIIGTNFTAGTSVTFGGVSAAFTVNSPTSITAFAPAHAAGSVDVQVTSPDGTSTAVLADQYLYVAAIPTVTSVLPANGPAAGGTLVTITGTNFTGATSVTFGGVSASFSVTSGTTISAFSPAHAQGIVHVQVTNGDGTSVQTAGDQFTYQ